MPARQDLTGKRFGRLTVLRCEGKAKHGKYQWLCRCDCGALKISDTGQLNSGCTQSCGCLKTEMLIKKNQTHNMAGTPIYTTWATMKRRCHSPKDKQYKDYGGRGIAVCDEWLSFEGFYKDMGDSYKPGLTLERIDNNKGYCNENCVWADRITQANNNSRNRFETVDGITDTVANHARRYGHTYAVVQHRLQRGWDVEEAFKTPRIFPVKTKN